jgi:hypothetical protein
MGLPVRKALGNAVFDEIELVFGEEVFEGFVGVDGEQGEADVAEDLVLEVAFGQTV